MMKFFKNIRIFKTMDKSFVSPMDRFLQQFNTQHKLSRSQAKEVSIHEQIANERDHTQTKANPKAQVHWPAD